MKSCIIAFSALYVLVSARAVQADSFTGEAGGGYHLSLRQPYVGMTFIIRLAGGDLGDIKLFAGGYAPQGWASCDGQVIPTGSYPDLFAVVGTTYGGGGRTIFGLPDFRGRTPLHPDSRLGESSGSDGVSRFLTDHEHGGLPYFLVGEMDSAGSPVISIKQPCLSVNATLVTDGEDPALPNTQAVTGQVRLHAGSQLPAGRVFLDGGELSVTNYPALAGVIGLAFGGDGLTMIGVPDLRDRAAMHAGVGSSLSPRVFATSLGQETFALTPGLIPPHSHTLLAPPYATALTGVNMPIAIPNIMPSLVLRYMICTNGVYPSPFSDSGSSNLLGEVSLYAGSMLPDGWAYADGDVLQVADHPALFSLLGTLYGGDGVDTFALPDLRGRLAVGTGSGAGLSQVQLGQVGGGEILQVTVQSMETHRHHVAEPLRAFSRTPSSRLSALADTPISVSFNRPVSNDTINATTFRVWGNQSGFYTGTWAYVSASTSGVFHASEEFKPGERITVMLSTNILAAASGIRLLPYQFEFRVAAEGCEHVTFSDTGQYLGTNDSTDLALGDLDGDGDLDAFVANGSNAFSSADQVWLNDGSGGFTPSSQTFPNEPSTRVALGDLDADGDLDAFVAAPGPDRVWLNHGDGTFLWSGQTFAPDVSTAIALGDLDGDAYLDALVGTGWHADGIWRNDGAGLFSLIGTAASRPINVRDCHLADLDDDGDLDTALWGRYFDRDISRNNGFGVFSYWSWRVPYPLADPHRIALGPLVTSVVRPQGVRDAWGACNGSNVVLENAGFIFHGYPTNTYSYTFLDTGQVLGTNASRDVALGDVDGDGDLDAWIANAGQHQTVWINNGVGTFGDPPIQLDVFDGRGVDVGDLDGDGDLDAFFAVGAGSPNRVFLNEYVDVAPNLVTMTDDGNPIDGPCGGGVTLREAVYAAGPGANITFAPTLSGRTILLTNGQIFVDKSLTIDASNLPEGITLDANANGRIFFLSTTGSAHMVTLDSLTLTGGSVGGGAGGAIVVQSNITLRVSRCTFYDNHADAGSGDGGAILSQGQLVVENSTFTQNSAVDRGGAIRVAGGTGMLQNITVVGNAAASGGGVFYDESTTLDMENSIAANNTGSDLRTLGPGGTFNDLGGNHIGSDPLLAMLEDYSGPTPTMPPLPGSPVVDAGIPNALTADQRGYPRPLGPAPDSGAVEGVYSATGPGLITDTVHLTDGSIQFAFTNVTGAVFPVLATTNIFLPPTDWPHIGFVFEDPDGSGWFPFTDLQATNYQQRYYRVESP